MLKIRYNYIEVYKMSKNKKKKVNMVVRIVGIFMLLLMLASPIIAILSYVIK